MKSILTAFILLLSIPLHVQELATRTILHGKVEMLIPDTFTIMSKDLIAIKYPNQKVPPFTEVYMNDRANTNIGFNETSVAVTEGQVFPLGKHLEKQIRESGKAEKFLGAQELKVTGEKCIYVQIHLPGCGY